MAWLVQLLHGSNCRSVFLGAEMSISQFNTTSYVSGQFGTGTKMSYGHFGTSAEMSWIRTVLGLECLYTFF